MNISFLSGNSSKGHKDDNFSAGNFRFTGNLYKYVVLGNTTISHDYQFMLRKLNFMKVGKSTVKLVVSIA